MAYPSFGYLNSVASLVSPQPEAPAGEPTLVSAPPGQPLPPVDMSMMPKPPPPPQPATVQEQQQPVPADTSQQQPVAPEGGSPQRELPRFIPISGGGIVPAHEAINRGPKATEAIMAGNQAVQQANTEATGIMAGAYQNEADKMADHAAILQKKADEEAAHAVRVQEFNDKWLKDRAAEADALANDQIDPGRLWARKSTPQKVASFLAIFLGGFDGRGNRALDMIDKEIERDIDAQQAAHQFRKDAYASKQNAYQTWLSGLQNADAARAMSKATLLSSMQAEVNRQTALTKNADVRARGIEASGKIKNDMYNEIAKGLTYVKASQSQAYDLDTKTGMRVPHKMALEHSFKLEEEDAKNGGKRTGDLEKRWVHTSSTGKGYYAPTEKEATDHRKMQESTQQAIDLIEALDKASDKMGNVENVVAHVTEKVPWLPTVKTEGVQTVESVASQLVGSVNQSNGFGALDDGGKKVVLEITGNPRSLLGNKAALRTLKASLIKRREQAEKAATGKRPDNVPEGTKRQAWTP